MAVWAVIPAAGMGRRMGSATSKQFLQLAGRPILLHTLEAFLNHAAIDGIVLVVPQAEQHLCRQQVLDGLVTEKPVLMVAGGAERQDSVRTGLAACAASDDDLVLIHDGVRPLFDTDLIAPLLRRTEETGAAIVAVPVKQTVKQVENGVVVETPERSRLWLAQTPQAFRLGLVRKAHEEALRAGFIGTDDAALVERLEHPVAIVEGDYRNIKITTPEDLVLAEALLGRKGGA